jgi:hypothetical protein
VTAEPTFEKGTKVTFKGGQGRHWKVMWTTPSTVRVCWGAAFDRQERTVLKSDCRAVV